MNDMAVGLRAEMAVCEWNIKQLMAGVYSKVEIEIGEIVSSRNKYKNK